AFFPPPGDERLKVKRGVVNRATKESRGITANEQSTEYIPHRGRGITNQAKLDELARLIYEQQYRQHLEGTVRTAEMVLYDDNNNPGDILALSPGDTIKVGARNDVRDFLTQLGSKNDQIRFLVQERGYREDVAILLVNNMDVGKY